MKRNRIDRVILAFCLLSIYCSAVRRMEEALLHKYNDRLLTLERTITEQNREISAMKALSEKQEQKIRKLENKMMMKENLFSDDFRYLEQNGFKNHSEKDIVRRLLVSNTAPTVDIHVKEEVAFFAERLTPLTNMGNYQSIVYDQVKVNHGGAYSGVDGEFLAPFGGIYVFSWTSSNGDNTHMVTEMVINGKRYAHTWTDSGNHADFSVASVTCVAELKKGDRVWIRSANIHSRTLTCDNNSMCSFTGFLLY